MSQHGRPPGYSGGRDWLWRFGLGTSLGSAGGLLCSNLAVGAGLLPSSRGTTASVAVNVIIASACLAGAEEIVRELRSGDPEDAVNALLGGAITGYTLGALKGGRQLAPSSAVGFSILSLGLHYSVSLVQGWRMRRMSRDLQVHGQTLSNEAGLADSAVQEAEKVVLESYRQEEARPLHGRAGKEPWVWPVWLPVRPSTPEEIAKHEATRRKWEEERGLR